MPDVDLKRGPFIIGNWPGRRTTARLRRLCPENYVRKNIANEKFNGKYSYDKFSFKNMTTKSTITCPKHGDFEMNLRNHAILGQECPKCKGRNLTTDDIKHMFEEKHHGKYNYDKVIYTKMHSKVTIT